MSELAHQIRNYSNFTWLNGSFLLDWLIHNLDVCCWVKNAWPVSAQGQGGRRSAPSPISCSTTMRWNTRFADGTRMFAQGRHIAGCWDFFGDVIHGAKGSAILGEGQSQPRIYKGHNQTPENLIWQYKGPTCNHYQYEHDLLFEAIRQDKPYNETERCAKAAMTGILGRMAAESGKHDHLGRGDGLEPRIGPGARPVHDGVQSAGDARRPGPLSDRYAGDASAVVAIGCRASLFSHRRQQFGRVGVDFLKDLLPRLGGRFGNVTHNGRADDQTVGHGRKHPHVLRPADAEADADRQRRLPAQPGDVLDDLRRQGGPLARDAGDRHVIDEPGRALGDAAVPDRGAWWA